MSAEQKTALDEMLRQGPLDIGGDVREQRDVLDAMLGAIPPPPDVVVVAGHLGSIPTVDVAITGVPADTVILYFHGGAHALGSAATSVGLAADLARRSNARAISVDYRLAPEHPYPAANEDAVTAYQALLDGGQDPATIALAGESAGGGLVASALVRLRDLGLPLPASAVMFSPWVDLTLAGASFRTNADLDPALTPAGMRTRADDYLRSTDASLPTVSPVFADLHGLPPLLIQSGSHEILLEDAVRLAARAAADHVEVTLQVWPGVPHVFQAFSAMLDEAEAALTAAGSFVIAHAATIPNQNQPSS